MSIYERSWFRTLFIVGLLLALGTVPVAAQDPKTDQEKDLRRILGNWTLNPIASDAPAPKAPPIYASYRKKGEDAPPALETIPRIFLELKEGKLAGKVVLPKAFPMTDENRDVAGKEAVAVDEVTFDGTELKFKVRRGEHTFEATGKLEGPVVKGTWMLGAERKGALYMHRRYR